MLLLLATAPEFAAELPSFFVPNAGRMNPAIRFFIQTPDLRAGFSAGAATFQMHGQTLQVRFRGANSRVEVEGADRLAAQANFFEGDRPEDWRVSQPVYGEILYRSLYPGIDMTYRETGRRIKSEFLLAPGADPSLIRLEYSATTSIGPAGELLVSGEHIEVREEAPFAYQESDAGRMAIPSRYKLLGGNTVGFDLGPYDHALPLVIDPVLSYATYLGGSGLGAVTALAVDSSGNLYATGWTEAVDFPLLAPVQPSNKGGVDVFIAKLNATGTALIYATYIGGRGDDRAAGIAVDASGQAYITGSTTSADFPMITPGLAPAQTTLGGGRDAFALKLNAAGTALLYSTFLGGSNSDWGTAIALDTADHAYIAGDTLSADFPLLGAAQPLLGGATDAFVTKLTPAGAVAFSTFLGGALDEHAGGIAVDMNGNVYVAGGTTSQNFPVVAAMQAVNGGAQDAFIAKISSAGSAILYSTYLGGSGGAVGTPEQANAIAVDADGNAYVAGVTNSPNFPVTASAFQTAFNAVEDAFVAKVNAAGNALVYCTYLGGTGLDWASGLAIDSSGNAYVAGYTSSFDFPAVAPLPAGFKGLYDAFVLKLSAAGNALNFSTYFGGTGSDLSNAIALDLSGNVFVGGQTNSLDLALQGALQSSNQGGSTGWVARIGSTSPPPQLPSAVSVSPASGTGNTVTLTAQFSDPAGGAALTTAALLLNTTASANNACQVSYTASTNQFTLADGNPCSLNGTAAAVISGNTLTLTLALTFSPGFSGAKTIYLYAADANSNTGWVARGSWTVTVPPPQPTATSVSPNNSTGSSQTFTFVFSDTQNPLNITAMAMLFSTSLNQTNACSVAVDQIAQTIALLGDNGTTSNSKPMGSSTVLRNSQCAVGASSLVLSGLSDIVTVSVTFQGSFSGLKNIYMLATENGGITTGWPQMGTYTVAAGGVPVPGSVVPAAGSGPGQRFSFTISDQGGASFLTGLAALFATSSGGTSNACYLIYDRTMNTVSLANDNPNSGVTAVVPGSSTIASNTQCTLKAVNTTVIVAITSVVVTMDLTFSPGFFGSKNVYLAAVEPGLNSAFATVGAWTVTGGVPSANSVSPSSGTGLSKNFTFTVSDSSSASNIAAVNMAFTSAAPTSALNTCSLVYNVKNATIGLYANDGVTLNTKALGSSAALQNSHCSVGSTSAVPSGNSIVLSVNLAFSATFNSTKTIYLQAQEPNASSGWVVAGTWIVP
jgi:hypothetical protein